MGKPKHNEKYGTRSPAVLVATLRAFFRFLVRLPVSTVAALRMIAPTEFVISEEFLWPEPFSMTFVRSLVCAAALVIEHARAIVRS